MNHADSAGLLPSGNEAEHCVLSAAQGSVDVAVRQKDKEDA